MNITDQSATYYSHLCQILSVGCGKLEKIIKTEKFGTFYFSSKYALQWINFCSVYSHDLILIFNLSYIHNCKIIAFYVQLFSLFVNTQMQINLDRLIGKLCQTPHFYFSILIHYRWSPTSPHLVLILSLVINNWEVGCSRWNENCPPQHPMNHYQLECHLVIAICSFAAPHTPH